MTTITTNSAAETKALAKDMAVSLQAGTVIALTGELGAGKTTFIQGLAEGLGIAKKYYVNSPTFTILNIYEGGRLPIYHFDWYRVNNLAEVCDLGLAEYFDGGGISVIEWAEKFPSILPAHVIWVKLEVMGAEKRRIIYGNKL